MDFDDDDLQRIVAGLLLLEETDKEHGHTDEAIKTRALIDRIEDPPDWGSIGPPS